jgi:hypothetical protein
MPVADGNNPACFRKTFVTDAIGTSKTVTVSGDNAADVYLDGVSRGSFPSWTTAGSFPFGIAMCVHSRMVDPISHDSEPTYMAG